MQALSRILFTIELAQRQEDPIWVGLLHLEIAALAGFAENAIRCRDYRTVQRCYDFAERAVAEGDQVVRNAICVSFLENILLVADTPEQLDAEHRLSESLRRELAELRAHWERISAKA